MQKPDLNKMWKTWVKIGLINQCTLKIIQDTIRTKMQPINQLEKDGKITWFYFLNHQKNDDPLNQYFEVIFTTNGTDPNEFLPDGCSKPEQVKPEKMALIVGINIEILKGEDIREACKLIGEQSKFIINLICAHKENQTIPINQIVQFMHFFMNPLGLGHKSLILPMGSFYGAQSF